MTDTATQTAHLTTGWEPNVPAGDTVLRRYVLHLAAQLTSAAEAAGGRVDRTDDVLCADSGHPTGFFNAALLLAPPAPDRWDDVLDHIEAFYARAGTGSVLLWSPWRTPDLAGRGWRLEGHPPLLIRPPGGPVPAAVPTVDVVEVTDRPTFDDWTRTAIAGFPLRELEGRQGARLVDERLVDDPRWRFWVAYDRGAPAAAGTLFTDVGVAQLALATTLPQARGRGAWYALVRERLLAAPHLLTGGVFSDDSRPGIERLDFLAITRFSLWHRPRPL